MNKTLSKIAATSLLGVALACGWTLTALRADEPGSPGIKVGDYRQLNFMRSIKLGTAPYVNPDLVKNSAVVYYYDPEAWKNVGIEEAVKAYNAGYWGIATAGDDEYHVGMIDKTKAVEILMNASKGSGFVIVSDDKKLFDTKPKGELVTWDAGETIKPQY